MTSYRAKPFREKLLEWGEENRRQFPWRDPDCLPYEVFVAEMLLRRTSAESVEPVYREFIDRYPDFQSLKGASQEELAEILRPLGIHNKRAEAFRKIASKLVFSGIPDAEEELLDLPHVGRYVANATLCFGFDQRKPIVDANVARIYSRVFDMEVKSEELHNDNHLWDFAESLLPEDRYRDYNLALLDHGAEVCTSQSPDCESCPVCGVCNYYQSGAD